MLFWAWLRLIFSSGRSEIPGYYGKRKQQQRGENFIRRTGSEMRKHGPGGDEEKARIGPFLKQGKFRNKYGYNAQNFPDT